MSNNTTTVIFFTILIAGITCITIFAPGLWKLMAIILACASLEIKPNKK